MISSASCRNMRTSAAVLGTESREAIDELEVLDSIEAYSNALETSPDTDELELEVDCSR